MSDNVQPVPVEMELVATSNKLSRQPPITLFSPKPNYSEKKGISKTNKLYPHEKATHDFGGCYSFCPQKKRITQGRHEI